MNLHKKEQFVMAVVANTPYNKEEALLLWDMLNTDTIDLLQALYTNMYHAGYKACEEDKMCS
jgi:hypothetical protein